VPKTVVVSIEPSDPILGLRLDRMKACAVLIITAPITVNVKALWVILIRMAAAAVPINMLAVARIGLKSRPAAKRTKALGPYPKKGYGVFAMLSDVRKEVRMISTRPNGILIPGLPAIYNSH